MALDSRSGLVISLCEKVLEEALALVPPDGLGAMPRMDVAECVQGRFHAPNLLQLMLVTHAAVLRQVEVPFRWVVSDEDVDVVRDSVGPRILPARVLECVFLAAHLGNLWRTVDLQDPVVRESQRDGRVLQVVDAAPVELALRVACVVGGAAALVEVAVVVACDNHDVAEAVSGPRPWLLQRLEPVDALLDGR